MCIVCCVNIQSFFPIPKNKRRFKRLGSVIFINEKHLFSGSPFSPLDQGIKDRLSQIVKNKASSQVKRHKNTKIYQNHLFSPSLYLKHSQWKTSASRYGFMHHGCSTVKQNNLKKKVDITSEMRWKKRQLSNHCVRDGIEKTIKSKWIKYEKHLKQQFIQNE